MVLRKRNFRKFTKRRAKKYVKRALRVAQVPKNKQTHFHVRRIGTITEADFSIDVNNANTNYYRAMNFKLEDLEGYTELTTLYDRYCITKVVLEWIWTITVPSGTTASGPNNSLAPYVNLVRDYDDDTVPDASYFRQSGRNVRRRLVPNRKCSIALTPAVAVSTYKTAISSGYSPKWKQSIDMTDSNVPHYGLKVQLNKPGMALGYVQCTAKYYVSCYQTR